MDLYENIAFPLREHTRKSEREIRKIVHDNAELVGLATTSTSFPARSPGA